MNSEVRSIDEKIVHVNRQPGDGRIAQYKESNIGDLHWSDRSGGVNAPLNGYYLFCRVWCDQMISGEVLHSCSHGSAPHFIKVCITKKHNDPSLFKKLSKEAGEKPKRDKHRPCKTAAVRHVKNNSVGHIDEIDLLNLLEADGYKRASAKRTLVMLVSHGKRLMRKSIEGEGDKLYFIPDQKK